MLLHELISEVPFGFIYRPLEIKNVLWFLSFVLSKIFASLNGKTTVKRKKWRKIHRRANEVYFWAWQSEMLPSALQLLYLRGFARSHSRWWATHPWATLLLAREFLRLHKPGRWDSSPQCWCFQAAAGNHQYLGELQQRVRKSYTS